MLLDREDFLALFLLGWMRGRRHLAGRAGRSELDELDDLSNGIREALELWQIYARRRLPDQVT